MRRLLPVLPLVVALLVAVAATPAAAHGGREVGPYELTVGFGAEPAYAGFPNSVQVLIAKDDKPFTAVKDGQLVVLVGNGDGPQTRFPLAPNFDTKEGWGTPGEYRADFVPTVAGSYTFRIAGTLPGLGKLDPATDSRLVFTSCDGCEGEGFDSPIAPASVAVPTGAMTAGILRGQDDLQAQVNRQAWLLGIVAAAAGLALIVSLALLRTRKAP